MNPQITKQFTGQQKEGDFYYMQARFYDPSVGRFLQPDSIVPDLMNPQSLNRYTYVLNNPLRYTDPTGHWPKWVEDAASATRQFVTSTLPTTARRSASWGWGATRWGSRQTQDAFLWTWSTSSNAAQTSAGAVGHTTASAWSSAPMEAVREYVADKEQDLAAFGRVTLNSPSALPQNALGLGIALTSVGDRRTGTGGFVFYQGCRGGCQVVNAIFGNPPAYTMGFLGASTSDVVGADTLAHENQHFVQSQVLGSSYLLFYGEELARMLVVCGGGSECNHSVNALEVDANSAEKQGLHDPFTHRDWP